MSEMAKPQRFRTDINNCGEEWVQVTISGQTAEDLSETDIEAALSLLTDTNGETSDLEVRMAIRIEKLMCERLGRPWTPSGISIVSLIDELYSSVPATSVIAGPADERISSAIRKLRILKRDFGMKGANATTMERAIDLMRHVGRTDRFKAER